MSTSAIPPTGRPTSATSGGGGGSVPFPAETRAPAPRTGEDGVIYRAHVPAVRSLLRERVLAATRAALSVERFAAPVHFAASIDAEFDAFVGRIRSEQNLLAAANHENHDPEERHELLAGAVVDGLSEALDVLFNVDELDEPTWRLVTAVEKALTR